MVQGGILTVIHQNPPKHYLDYVKENKAAVILIPGILGKWSFMKKMGDNISLEGHPVYIVPKLGYNIASIPSSAEKIKELADGISGKIVIVAHSKGGLIGKYFLAHHNQNQKVLGMVAVASPFTGSALANLIPHDSFRELKNDSKIIENLEKHNEINNKIISIIPEYDNHVLAERGSFLPGAVNIEVNVKGHHKVIFDKDVIKIVIEEVNKMV